MNYLDVTIDKLLQRENIFLTGGAGVGKTTITKQVITYFESEAKKVAKLASTGMAATLIGGQTLHSFFDLGIADDIVKLEANGKYEIKKKIKNLVHAMDLIVIDEISMVSDALFEMIILRLHQAEFHGVLLVVGDFLQLPPVVRGIQEVHFAFESQEWKQMGFTTIELTHIYRTDDIAFIELLHHVRFASISENIHKHLNEYIKPLPCEYKNYTFLFGKNYSADQHNKQELALIEGELFLKEVQIIKHLKSIKEYEIEHFINDARIERQMYLKIGAPVLFTRNSWNYFNGEQGEVIAVEENYVYIQKTDRKIIKLERVAHSKTRWSEKILQGKKELFEEDLFTLYQFPIKLAFGITIHKSQGMSIANLIIETNEIFAPSQFYVALSRSSNPQNLILIAPHKQWHELVYVAEKAMVFVKNSLS